MAINDEERRQRLAALGAKAKMPTPEGEAKMSAVILQAYGGQGDNGDKR